MLLKRELIRRSHLSSVCNQLQTITIHCHGHLFYAEHLQNLILFSDCKVYECVPNTAYYQRDLLKCRKKNGKALVSTLSGLGVIMPSPIQEMHPIKKYKVPLIGRFYSCAHHSFIRTVVPLILTQAFKVLHLSAKIGRDSLLSVNSKNNQLVDVHCAISLPLPVFSTSWSVSLKTPFHKSRGNLFFKGPSVGNVWSPTSFNHSIVLLTLGQKVL